MKVEIKGNMPVILGELTFGSLFVYGNEVFLLTSEITSDRKPHPEKIICWTLGDHCRREEFFFETRVTAVETVVIQCCCSIL